MQNTSRYPLDMHVQISGYVTYRTEGRDGDEETFFCCCFLFFVLPFLDMDFFFFWNYASWYFLYDYYYVSL